ncbi:MAG: tetratricopeptide repeat protein [Candidatus Bipolaricaulota bacterium]
MLNVGGELRYGSGGREDLVPPLPEPGELTETERRELCERALEQVERLRREKRYREGIDILVEALKYGLEKPLVYFRLGNIYFDSGDLSRAEYTYKRAIDEDPQYASAYNNLGVVYRKQGRVSESVRYLKKARRLELRYPQRRKPSDKQRENSQLRGFPMRALPIIVIVALVIVALLVSRLT